MKKTKIEWCDYSVNPVKGICPVGCNYCYAIRLYRRFGWNPEIRFDESVLEGLSYIPKGSKVFIGSTIELFGPWIQQAWLERIFQYCRAWESLNFIFLTKQPQKLMKWSPFPKNYYIGISATNQAMHNEAIIALDAIEATVKFISYEPLHEEISLHSPYDLEGINWVICGAQTPYSLKTAPEKIWINEIIEATQKAGIPYFLKDNLKPIMGDKLVQDFPTIRGIDLDH